MHHHTITVFENCRFLKNLNDLSQFLPSTSQEILRYSRAQHKEAYIHVQYFHQYQLPGSIIANSVDLFQMLQNAASKLDQHCLLTGISMQNIVKMKKKKNPK